MASNDVLGLSGLQTEAANRWTSQIDQVPTLQMCSIINDEDRTVAASVTPCLHDIARAIDSLVPRVRRGGRVIYIGAGTSGRYVGITVSFSYIIKSNRLFVMANR